MYKRQLHPHPHPHPPIHPPRTRCICRSCSQKRDSNRFTDLHTKKKEALQSQKLLFHCIYFSFRQTAFKTALFSLCSLSVNSTRPLFDVVFCVTVQTKGTGRSGPLEQIAWKELCVCRFGTRRAGIVVWRLAKTRYTRRKLATLKCWSNDNVSAR